MTDHLIIPPPELFKQWEGVPRSLAFLAAYQAGADQELEACVEWAANTCPLGTAINLRAARRSKPPSLKEQALEDLGTLLADLKRHGLGANTDTIRRALEALND